MSNRTEAERATYRPEIIQRFWSRVDQSAGEDGCWPWTGHTKGNGFPYGGFRADSVGFMSHRWMLGMLRGEPLKWSRGNRESACHRCDNPPCCNPKHLYVGDPQQNILDSVERGRHFGAAQTHCKWGHPFSGSNLYIQPSTGQRHCRECRRRMSTKTNRRRRAKTS